MENWKQRDTDLGVPQGAILSPLLSNVYLNELDKFVENSLIPAYTRGERRRKNPAYRRFEQPIAKAREEGDRERCRTLVRQRRQLPSIDPYDPNFRRLRYVRYADDFLLGFAGPKSEAEEIRQRLKTFLQEELHLQLSTEKTLITHATSGKAKFLGYEITTSRCDNRLSKVKGQRERKRIANGRIALLMPKKVIQDVHQRYSNVSAHQHHILLAAGQAA